jgi:hypothetical protein
MGKVGEVNGDGYSDVVVGRSFYHQRSLDHPRFQPIVDRYRHSWRTNQPDRHGADTRLAASLASPPALPARQRVGTARLPLDTHPLGGWNETDLRTSPRGDIYLPLVLRNPLGPTERTDRWVKTRQQRLIGCRMRWRAVGCILGQDVSALVLLSAYGH